MNDRIFVAILLLITSVLSACAHDPEPFAREESYEEEQNRENQQALQARQRQEDFDQQNLEASRAEEESEQERASSNDQQTVETAQSEADARKAAREASETVRSMELPQVPSVGLPTVTPVLRR